jgi:hypothetical protein
LESYQNLKGAVHLQIDGWSAPIVVSFLGIVASWEEGGEIKEIVLEFVK